MTTLLQMRGKIKRLVRDEANVLTDPGDYDLALSRALQTYSLQRPNPVTQDLFVNSDHVVLVASITGFDRAYIDKLQIEYPVLETFGQPNYLDRSEWFLYQSPAGLAIRFTYSPSSSQAMRITHAVPHVIPVDGGDNPDDEGDLTVIASDIDAVSSEGAANAHEMMSAYFTQTADKSTGADFVAFTTKANEYKKRADMLHGVFNSHMEKSLGMSKGSFQVVRS